MELKEWLGENNTIGQDIWNNKYRYNNESLDEWLDRVSGGDQKLRKLIAQRKFLFGGRALANRGTGRKGSLNNCYSAGYVDDDIESIMQMNMDLALTFKAQGGQGVSLSKIRPKGTPIGDSFESDGIVPFMEIFNTTTSSISQGGARKGALMISLDIRHKEAPTFITIKTNEDKITKANLSLEIDDEFMKAVELFYKTGEVITLHEQKDYNGHIVEYDIIPVELYKLMMTTVYDWGEPGCIFTNSFRNYNLMEFDEEYEVDTSNPCGEQPLKKHTSCNLGSINLSEFVKNPYTDEAYFDFDEFKEAIKIAIRALDNIIDENLLNHPLQEQRDNAKNFRNVGLGVFGYANALFKLGLTYGKKSAQTFTELLFRTMFYEALWADTKLAKEKGKFPKCKPEKIIKSRIVKNLMDNCKDAALISHIKKYGLRNCSLLSIAPTGSIATMMGCAGGCEPEFALKYTRHTDNLKESYEMYCKSIQEYFKVNGDTNIPKYFITTADINWKDRVDTQAVMQKYVDTAISSTVNLPQSTPVEDIEKLYLYAWQKDLKGITIWRDGCKKLGILTTSNKEDEIREDDAPKRGEVVQMPDSEIIGFKKKLMTGCGSLHCAAYFDVNTGNLVETYLSKGSSGGCNNYMIALSRMISAAARAGVSIDDIVDQLMSTGTCPSYATRTAIHHDTSKGSCCAMAVGYALKEMWEEFNNAEIVSTKKKTSVITHNHKNNSPVCPICGEPLQPTNGCWSCTCGYSKCD